MMDVVVLCDDSPRMLVRCCKECPVLIVVRCSERILCRSSRVPCVGAHYMRCMDI